MKKNFPTSPAVGLSKTLRYTTRDFSCFVSRDTAQTLVLIVTFFMFDLGTLHFLPNNFTKNRNFLYFDLNLLCNKSLTISKYLWEIFIMIYCMFCDDIFTYRSGKLPTRHFSSCTWNFLLLYLEIVHSVKFSLGQ